MSWTRPERIGDMLRDQHYLGAIDRGVAWCDDYGAIVIAPPTARRIPARWLELSRWCIASGVKDAGSKQWAGFARALRELRPDVSTLVSYSDPGVGHRGALYRACNWWWAPTWHRLRPPPSGNGAWQPGQPSTVKDRWIFPLGPDPRRVETLIMKDKALLKRHPWLKYAEPGGVPYKRAVAEGLI